jgi:hypothetical protein
VTAAAALISALAGTGWSFNNSSTHESEAAAVQKSILAVVEYRLSVVERACGVAVVSVPAPAPAPVVASVAMGDNDGLEESDEPVAATPAAAKVVTPPTYQEIVNLAQRGQSWTPKE